MTYICNSFPVSPKKPAWQTIFSSTYENMHLYLLIQDCEKEGNAVSKDVWRGVGERVKKRNRGWSSLFLLTHSPAPLSRSTRVIDKNIPRSIDTVRPYVHTYARHRLGIFALLFNAEEVKRNRRSIDTWHDSLRMPTVEHPAASSLNSLLPCALHASAHPTMACIPRVASVFRFARRGRV